MRPHPGVLHIPRSPTIKWLLSILITLTTPHLGHLISIFLDSGSKSNILCLRCRKQLHLIFFISCLSGTELIHFSSFASQPYSYEKIHFVNSPILYYMYYALSIHIYIYFLIFVAQLSSFPSKCHHSYTQFSPIFTYTFLPRPLILRKTNICIIFSQSHKPQFITIKQIILMVIL